MEPATIAAIANVIIQAAQASGLFGNSPEQNAKKYYDKIPGTLDKHISPYIDKFNQLEQNPTKKLDELGANYKESPGYQYALKQALQAGTNSAAAGGMLGTPMHQQEAMETASGLASKDFENYLKHALDLYGTGLGGGYSASKGLGEDLSNIYQQQGQMSALGGEQKDKNWANIFGNITSLIPQLFDSPQVKTAANRGASMGAAGANFGGFK